jgi:hypothetical protein
VVQTDKLLRLKAGEVEVEVEVEADLDVEWSVILNEPT